MHERLSELELKFTEQQQLLSELSDVLFAQQREIDGLRAALVFLQSKLAADPGLVDAKADERPPHY